LAGAGIAALLLLTGCGFRPLYGPAAAGGGDSPAVAQQLAAISVSPVPDRRGQEMRNRLSDSLAAAAPDTPHRYALNLSMSEIQQSLAVRLTGFATRANLQMTTYYTLVDIASGQPVLAGTVFGIQSYDLLDEDFANLTAINDARSRVIAQMAGDLRNRLAVFFASQPAPAPPTP
jgi:LPS-assembly lipoprotein